MFRIVLLFLLLSPNIDKVDEVHALYLSVIDVNIDEEVMKIEVKVFTDDLLDVLKNQNSQMISTATKLSNAEIEEYFQKHLSTTDRGQNLQFSLDQITLEGESHFIHFSCPLPEGTSNLSVQAAYFMELFPTQQNILKVRKGDKNHFAIFKSMDQIETVSL